MGFVNIRNTQMPLKRFYFAVCLWLIAGISVQVHAQSIIAGDVTGIVTDPAGAAVPGAAIALTNLNTGTSQSAVTNNEGSYRFAFVPPGTYKVSVMAGGF